MSKISEDHPTRPVFPQFQSFKASPDNVQFEGEGVSSPRVERSVTLIGHLQGLGHRSDRDEGWRQHFKTLGHFVVNKIAKLLSKNVF